MNAEQPTLNSFHAAIAFAVLFVLHIVLGIVLGIVTSDGPPTILLAVFVGLFFAQTTLLGFVGGLVNVPWHVRLLLVIFGTLYLNLLFCAGLDIWHDPQIIVLSTLPILGTALVALIIRTWLARLVRESGEATNLRAEGLQFSIRHLLILMIVVGCLMGIGRVLQPWFDSMSLIADFVAYSLCFIAVGVTSIWAMLGKSLVLLRSAVVLSLAIGVACIPTFLIARGDFWFWALMMFMESASLLATFFFVRLYGYRLVRLRTATNGKR